MSRTAKGVAYLAAAQVAFLASGYVTNVWLGRHLGPATYGTYGVLISLMTALNVLQVWGVPQAVSRQVAEGDDAAADAVLGVGLRLQLVLTAALALVFLLCAPLFADLFHGEDIAAYLRAMALIFLPYGIFSLYGGYYNGRRDFRRQALLLGLYAAAKLVLVVVLALAYGLAGVIAGFVVAPLVALAAGWRRPRYDRAVPYRSLAVYSLPLMGFAVLWTLQLSMDLFSLRALQPDITDAGYYTAAQNIALIPLLTMTALGQVIFPSISRLLAAGRRDEAGRTTWESVRFLLLVLLPGTAILVGTAPTVVRLLFGRSYDPAAPILRVLVTSYLTLAVFALLANVLNGSGRATRAMLLAGAGAAVSLLCCLLLIPRFGTTGAAVATGLSGVLPAVGALVAVRRMFPTRLPWLRLARIGAGSALVLAIGWLLTPPTPALPALWVGLGAVYLGFLWLTGELTGADVSRFTGIVRRPARQV